MKKVSPQKFNKKFKVGDAFIWQPNKHLRGGYLVHTMSEAYELFGDVVVTCDLKPRPLDINIIDLTPASEGETICQSIFKENGYK